MNKSAILADASHGYLVMTVGDFFVPVFVCCGAML